MISGRWFKSKRLWAIVRDIASVIGVFALIIEIADFFPSLKTLVDFLQQRYILIILVTASLVYAFVKNRPRNEFTFKINNRDVELSLKIGSIEDLDSAYVVPVNSEFDMHLSGSVSASKSIQSMVIAKYFAGDHKTLEEKITKELQSEIYAPQKEGGKYKLGTTVRIETDDKKHAFYLVANSHKLNDRRVEANERDLSKTLSEFWAFVSTNGAKEHIAIPLLGTGNGRLRMPREEVYKEIVRSFIASCAGKVYCDRVTVVIRDEDITKCDIDVDELVDFLRLQTKFADFYMDTNEPAVGHPLSGRDEGSNEARR